MSEELYSADGYKLMPVCTEPKVGDRFVFIGSSEVERETRKLEGALVITGVRQGSGQIYETNLPRPWGPLRRECFFGNSPESDDKYLQCRILCQPEVTRDQARDAVDEITLLKRELSALRAELQRKDAARRDFAAAWREVAHRSGVKLEAWEDDEYILSAPERGPCGMTIHRRHATVLNAALENLENNDGK